MIKQTKTLIDNTNLNHKTHFRPFFMIDGMVQGSTIIRRMANGSNKNASKVALYVEHFCCDLKKSQEGAFSGITK